MDESYDFFMKADLSAYLGKWIAICDNKIVSSGTSVKQVLEDARKKCPAVEPLVARVSEKETMIF